MYLDYDLSDISVNQNAVFTTATNPQSGMSYHIVEMQVEVTVSQVGARIDVLWGKVQDLLGVTGRPGYLLASKTIGFPERGAVGEY